VITVAYGRREHLRRQRDGIAAARPGPDVYIVVELGEPGHAEDVEPPHDSRAVQSLTVQLPIADPGRLPVAAGRNAGAARALRAGAELLVFLDVDCIPAPSMLRWYQAAAADPQHRDALLCGPVAYLPPPAPTGYDLNSIAGLARPHAARPAPAAGLVENAEDRRLFWSLSFAVTAATWNRVGGFCEQYVGYGGEDTDYAEIANRAGVGMRWVGGAESFHQFHPVSTPPVEHLEAILDNAGTFFARWGWWPMTGWLEAFAELGVAGYDPDRGWFATA
jgi:GT2 family glycosyltransferase